MNEANNPNKDIVQTLFLDYDIVLQHHHIHFQSSLLTVA